MQDFKTVMAAIASNNAVSMLSHYALCTRTLRTAAAL